MMTNTAKANKCPEFWVRCQTCVIPGDTWLRRGWQRPKSRSMLEFKVFGLYHETYQFAPEFYHAPLDFLEVAP